MLSGFLFFYIFFLFIFILMEWSLLKGAKKGLTPESRFLYAGVAQLNSRKARQATHTQHIFSFFFFIDSLVATENNRLQRAQLV